MSTKAISSVLEHAKYGRETPPELSRTALKRLKQLAKNTDIDEGQERDEWALVASPDVVLALIHEVERRRKKDAP